MSWLRRIRGMWLPKKQVSAAALIINQAREVLLVKPRYQGHWLLPGGATQAGESPRQACIREVREELGLTLTPERLLCVVHTHPTAKRTEAMGFIFWSGVLSPEQIGEIVLPAAELQAYDFWPLDKLDQCLSPFAAERVRRGHASIDTERTVYLED